MHLSLLQRVRTVIVKREEPTDALVLVPINVAVCTYLMACVTLPVQMVVSISSMKTLTAVSIAFSISFSSYISFLMYSEKLS